MLNPNNADTSPTKTTASVSRERLNFWGIRYTGCPVQRKGLRVVHFQKNELCYSESAMIFVLLLFLEILQKKC